VTAIEWTDVTWNPVTGCTKVSAGCDHCYAERMAERFRGTPAFPSGFDLTLRPERLDAPLRWRKPRRVFEVVAHERAALRQHLEGVAGRGLHDLEVAR